MTRVFPGFLRLWRVPRIASTTKGHVTNAPATVPRIANGRTYGSPPNAKPRNAPVTTPSKTTVALDLTPDRISPTFRFVVCFVIATTWTPNPMAHPTRTKRTSGGLLRSFHGKSSRPVIIDAVAPPVTESATPMGRLTMWAPINEDSNAAAVPTATTYVHRVVQLVAYPEAAATARDTAYHRQCCMIALTNQWCSTGSIESHAFV